MDIINVITKEQNLRREQAQAVIRLIDEGNTIPFIARYRKEQHGNMSDEQLRAFDERLRYLRALDERRKTILSAIEAQGKLTPELRKEIGEAMTATALEDLYRPLRPKRRTRAMIAKEKGLQPLADYLLLEKTELYPQQEAQRYVNKEAGIPDADTALHMAMDILSEMLSDDAKERAWIREKTLREGRLVTEKTGKPGKAAQQNEKLAQREAVYEMYYEYSEPLSRIPGHRILAVNRGEKEKFLSVRIEAPQEEIVQHLYRRLNLRKTASGDVFRENEKTAPYLQAVAADAYKRLIAPSIETELRGVLTQKAEDGAMTVFASNLRQLLMQAPVEGKVVLGWDPAFRTGCKLAVVDRTGKVLATRVIFPTAPQNKVKEAKEELNTLCRRYGVDVISCGNGTASRESEQVIADFIKESGLPLKYAIVNEAGASVYSASELATEEFPQFDVGQRSAASIARRLQDPLAELVKIDPKAIGVGQYQHDMNQTKLGETLHAVVEDCVNQVGVDVNTASAALLSYISGINKTTAKNIVAYREANGRFRSRRELLKVPKLGPKAFEQCAGFLRITGGSEPLDMTAVHPESYDAARIILKELGYTPQDIAGGRTGKLRERVASMKVTAGGMRGGAAGSGAAGNGRLSLQQLSRDTGLGEYTLQDVLSELAQPGRDPRLDVQGPVLRQDVLSLEDLQPGMELRGTVRNVVDFGAFVDIGVHQDGLVHISKLSDHFVKHPLDVVHVGDIVDVQVLDVDRRKGRISLRLLSPVRSAGISRRNAE